MGQFSVSANTHFLVANGLPSTLGHVYKILSYWLIFKATFVLGVRKPYDMLAIETARLKEAIQNARMQSMVLERSITPIVITDINGVINWQNSVSLSLDPHFGPGPHCIFDKKITPDANQVAQMRDTVFAGKVWRGRVTVRSLLGMDLHLDRRVTPYRSEDGQLDGFICLSENLTESVMAESRHTRVLDTALDGFWVVDRAGHFTEANAAYCSMTGYTKEELLSMQIADIEANMDSETIERHAATVATQGSNKFRTTHKRKDGTLMPVEISATFDSETQSFYVFVRDRTENEKAADAKHDLERQLNQSQKMQALGQLTGGIAHDFNNILASMLGYASLALSRFSDRNDPKLNKYLKEIVTSGERARDLIAKMLAFSRTQPDGPVGLVSAAAIAEEAITMLRPSIPSTIEIFTRFDTDAKVRIDAGELNQVLVNMIINARDAVDGQGKIEVRVHTANLKQALCAITGQRITGRFLCIEVADTGCGIAPENFSSVFDPFFTTKDVGKGTGLGLSVVQGIIRKSGGHILICSELGKGARFQLLFKLQAEKETKPAEEKTSTALPENGTGQLIWVVDDDRAVADYVGELLGEYGYSVRVFHDPVVAMNAFKAEQPELGLLVTDQTMPGLTGVQLSKILRAIRPALPIIICTGFSDGIPANDLQGQTFQNLLIKPVPSELLLKSISNILSAEALP